MTDYEKLCEIYEEIDELIDKKVESSSPDFQAWKMKTEQFLIRKFGENSIEYKDFKKRSFTIFLPYSSNPHAKHVEACKEDLLVTKAIFKNYLDELEEDTDENLGTGEDLRESPLKTFSEIFIVHGHDGELKEATALLVERAGIIPIILNEQANKGATIIEKLENNTDVPAAICLFTADDLGREKTDETEQMRARQNVVFETGFLMGKLGRENIIIIADEGIEIPSDLEGVVYSGTKDWKMFLLRELSEMGYNVDVSKATGIKC